MEKYSYILGFLSLGEFLAMCFFATVGIAISLLIDSQKRDQNSIRTPQKFSWLFLLKDNWKTIVLTALVVLMTLRFVTSFFPDQFVDGDLGSPQGIEKWMFGSLLIGVFFNQLIQIWKKRAAWLQVDKK
jgi:hypothetical protein